MIHRATPISARARSSASCAPPGERSRLFVALARHVEVAEPTDDVGQVGRHPGAQRETVGAFCGNLVGIPKQAGRPDLLIDGNQLRREVARRKDSIGHLSCARYGTQSVRRGGSPSIESADGLPCCSQPGVYRRGVGSPRRSLGQERVTEPHTHRVDSLEDALVDRRGEPICRRPRRGRRRRSEHGKRRAGTRQRSNREQLEGPGVEPCQRTVEHLANHTTAVRGRQQFPDEQWIAAGTGLQLRGIDRRTGLGDHQPADCGDVKAAQADELRYPSKRFELGHVGLVVAARRHERHPPITKCSW